MSAPLDIPWVRDVDVSRIPSPALLISKEAVRENLRRMIVIAGRPQKLRPHVKTHKLAWIVEEHLRQGITKFKCATIAEAELCGQAGAPDVLLAMQLVGPAVDRFVELCRKFPNTTFSTLADDAGVITALDRAASTASQRIPVFLDLDIGQQRSGVAPGATAMELYRQIAQSKNLTAAGLHAYDGHIHDVDPIVRAQNCAAAFEAVHQLRMDLNAAGLPVRTLLVGGTPTFPMHAKRDDVECSPGTCVLWDAGYALNLPDLEFQIAAVLLARVVSKPATGRICLDLGHKAVASEMPHPRLVLLGLPDAAPLAHNEEHYVVGTNRAAEIKVGDTFFAAPWHVCPTIALHAEGYTVENGAVSGTERVVARARRITV